MIRLSIAVAFALLGCSGGSRWQPAPSFGELVVSGDAIVRGEADGSTSVALTIVLDQDHAVGTVRLVDTPIAEASRSPHLALARARGWQVLAKRLEATPERAFEAARRGVAEIESCCSGDARMYAKAAEAQFADPTQRAAALGQMQTVLENLVEAYVRRHHASAL
jgi:hypothetical protein